ncbi:hypothetical protein F4801DRAFT_574421 [Xylaria longipes]|nr:hypothetical protein F4801DRAFT_574421 [Xylaria longipes]
MAFVPHPAAVHDYMDNYRQNAFVLGGLPTSVYQETIEKALRRFSPCAGNVAIYWPKLPRTHPDQKHRGWCHEEFERTTPIPVFPLDMVSLGAPSATAQNAPAPAPFAAATTTSVTPVTPAAVTETTDSAAVVPAYPERAEFEHVYDTLQRLDLSVTDMPTREIWQQTVEALGAAKELIWRHLQF